MKQMLTRIPETESDSGFFALTIACELTQLGKIEIESKKLKRTAHRAVLFLLPQEQHHASFQTDSDKLSSFKYLQGKAT